MYFFHYAAFGIISPLIFAVASKGLAYFVVVDVVDGLLYFWGEFLFYFYTLFLFVESDVKDVKDLVINCHD